MFESMHDIAKHQSKTKEQTEATEKMRKETEEQERGANQRDLTLLRNLMNNILDSKIKSIRESMDMEYKTIWKGLSEHRETHDLFRKFIEGQKVFNKEMAEFKMKQEIINQYTSPKYSTPQILCHKCGSNCLNV